MVCEMATSSQSSQTNNPLGSISILVVDDDTTCLSIVAAILKSWKYEVVTVKHASDALYTLRLKGGSFDLVVTDVHMPDMNGFELQKQIEEEFKLPVVFMSVDGKDSVILKGLQSGGAFFIVKPISPEDLKNLWQYAVATKRSKAIIKEIESDQEASKAEKACSEDTPVQETSHADKGFNEDINSASSRNEDRQNTKDYNAETATKNNNAEKGEKKDDSSIHKKAKVIWTNALHNQFLEAIRSIGLERAVPKKILELMNVPGLTRENVASHLQKYRIFLKRVSEASCNIQSDAERSKVERTFRSAFSLGQSSFLYDRSPLRHPQPQDHKQMRTSFPQRHLSHVPVVKAPNLDYPSSSNQKASCSMMAGSAKPPYQVLTSGFRMEPNNHRTSLPLCGNTSSDLMSGKNFIQTYQQKSQVALRSFNNGLSKYNSTTSGVHDPSGISGFRKNEVSNSSNLNLNPNCYSNNYAGYRMAGDGSLVKLGYIGIGYEGAEASTGFNHNNGFINGTRNGNYRSMPVLSSNSGDHLTQGLIDGLKNNGNMNTVPVLSVNSGESSSIGFESAFNRDNGMINVISGDHLAQGVSPSLGIESAIHVSPTFPDSIREENICVPPLPSTPLHQQSFSDGVEGGYIFGLLNNVSDSNSNPFQQPCGEGDLSFTFPDQINIQSLTQQPGGEVMVSDFGIGKSQLNEYFPSFHHNPSQGGLKKASIYVYKTIEKMVLVLRNSIVCKQDDKELQQDDEEFLDSILGLGEYAEDDNP